MPGPGLSTVGDDFFQCTERGEYFFRYGKRGRSERFEYYERNNVDFNIVGLTKGNLVVLWDMKCAETIKKLFGYQSTSNNMV